MAFQWTATQLVEDMKEFIKFVERPGIKDNFGEALDKFRIPLKTQRKWGAIIQLSKFLEQQDREIAEISKAILWKTDDPKRYHLHVEFLRPVSKKT